MYEAVTRGIRVRVTPQYMEDQSEPEDEKFFWAYTVAITNETNASVQLKSRTWRITNALGHTEEIRGAGVIGQTPTIQPGATFSYSSGCPLSTPSGLMVGSYEMASPDGALFTVAIPAFSLDSPYALRHMH